MPILHGELFKCLKDSPEWAEWLAQDADGSWWAYEVEPNQQAIGWYENEVGRYVKVGHGAPNAEWRDSLRRISRFPAGSSAC